MSCRAWVPGQGWGRESVRAGEPGEAWSGEAAEAVVAVGDLLQGPQEPGEFGRFSGVAPA
ncbi:hypothetical protein GCM10010439_64980 [Actinocorallia aurantiaca]|uniref:Uncharacterized protein n=1 Tax=Actinocorallia aurantiaca TaxID=46204 RepID=A0ABP6H750_9ACTN